CQHGRRAIRAQSGDTARNAERFRATQRARPRSEVGFTAEAGRAANESRRPQMRFRLRRSGGVAQSELLLARATLPLASSFGSTQSEACQKPACEQDDLGIADYPRNVSLRTPGF